MPASQRTTAATARQLSIDAGQAAYAETLTRLDNREALYALEAITDARAGLDVLAREAVHMARADSETWEAIGNALGVSKQAAQQWFRRNTA